MCNCPPEAHLGNYQNQVTFVTPPKVLEEYMRRRRMENPRAAISIDRCILSEVKALWYAGIKTYGSCCGHNGEAPPSIAVAPECIDQMKQMGYIPFKDLPHVFKSRTIP